MKLKERLRKLLAGQLAKRAGDAGIGALAVGAVASLFGVDIAPTEVDAIVTAGAILLAAVDRWRTARKAQS